MKPSAHATLLLCPDLNHNSKIGHLYLPHFEFRVQEEASFLMISILTMNFDGPSTPRSEYETTACAIPEGATEEDLEATVTAIYGRVNILDNVIYRDLPDCLLKAELSTMWGGIYGLYFRKHRLYCVGASGGARYADGTYLNPDLSVWDHKDASRRFRHGEAQHLMRRCPAPNWVLEYAWFDDVLKPSRGVDKVVNWYFTKVGTNQTTVNEAWLLVKHQDVDAPEQPVCISWVLRLLRELSDVVVIGTLLFWPLLWLLDLLTGTNSFTGKTCRRHAPPQDPRIPYIMVYFREDAPVAYGYYWLHWNEKFYPPPRSLYHGAPPLPADEILHRMRAAP
jgi:hypothetical protein